MQVVQPIVPPEAIQAAMRAIMGGGSSSTTNLQVAFGAGPPKEFLDKITPQHVSDIIKHTAADKQRANWLYFAAFVITIAAFLGLCWLFLSFGKDAIPLLKDVLLVLTGFAGGCGAAFGYAKWGSAK